jgi:hypothetical protein
MTTMTGGRWTLMSVVVGAGLVASGPIARAQDAHYWPNQYGPVAQLVGGQLIGTTRDLSATYYNPAGLALTEQPNFLLSAESFEIESIGVRLGSESVFPDQSFLSVRPAPTFIAGSMPRRWLGHRRRIAWSALTRYRFNARFNPRRADSGDSERSGGEVLFDQAMSENWFGVTVSERRGPGFALGVTGYVVYRGQRVRREVMAQATGPQGVGITSVGLRDFDFTHFRALGKVGVGWESGALQLGLTVTTPSAGLFSWGRAGYTRSETRTGDGEGARSVLVNGAWEDLSVNYGSSWAVGVGGGLRRGRTQVHASAEWFAPVAERAVLDVGPEWEGAPPTLGRRGVVNAGIGLQHDLRNKASLFAAFSTDFESDAVGAPASVSISTWDLYHLTAGGAFSALGSRFTLGASWAFGRDDRSGFIPELGGASTDSRPMSVSYSSVRVVMGFVFGE